MLLLLVLLLVDHGGLGVACQAVGVRLAVGAVAHHGARVRHATGARQGLQRQEVGEGKGGSVVWTDGGSESAVSTHNASVVSLSCSLEHVISVNQG